MLSCSTQLLLARYIYKDRPVCTCVCVFVRGLIQDFRHFSGWSWQLIFVRDTDRWNVSFLLPNKVGSAKAQLKNIKRYVRASIDLCPHTSRHAIASSQLPKSCWSWKLLRISSQPHKSAPQKLKKQLRKSAAQKLVTQEIDLGQTHTSQKGPRALCNWQPCVTIAYVVYVDYCQKQTQKLKWGSNTALVTLIKCTWMNRKRGKWKNEGSKLGLLNFFIQFA